jgi:hypothetical protein
MGLIWETNMAKQNPHHELHETPILGHPRGFPTKIVYAFLVLYHLTTTLSPNPIQVHVQPIVAFWKISLS